MRRTDPRRALAARMSPALTLALLACAHGEASTGRALRAAENPHADARTLGVAAITELDLGHGDAARSLLARSDAEAPDLSFQIARLLASEDRLDATGERAAAVRLIELGPHEPTAPMAAAVLQRLTGQSTHLDIQLEADLGRLVATSGAATPDLETLHRLRDALATLAVAHGDYGTAQSLREASGVLQTWQIVGPLSPYHYLQFDTPLGPEIDPTAQTYQAPWGAEAWRPLRMNNGQLPIGHSLELSEAPADEARGHAPTGDVVYLRTTVEASRGGLWLRSESSVSIVVFLDGKQVLVRDLFRRVLPRSQWIDLPCRDGPHTLLVKVAVGDASGQLRFEALPHHSGDRLPQATGAIERRLEALLGPPGTAVAARAVADHDPNAALNQLSALAELGVLGLSLRSQLWSALGTLDDEDARGRTERDLNLWVERDPHSQQAHLRRAQLLAELNRAPLAQADLDVAAAGGESVALLVAKARLLLQRDAGALARPALERALALDPGDCGAIELLLSSSEQQNAFTATEALSQRDARCPGGQQARALRRARSEGPAPLVAYWRGRLQRSPSDPEAALQLADALVALGDFGGAAAALDVRLKSWPGDGAALRKKANLADLAGLVADSQGIRAESAPPVAASNTPAAAPSELRPSELRPSELRPSELRPSELWREALRLDPGDLTLRRALALLASEPEPLEELLPQAAAALAAPRWSGGARAPSATLLDSGAAWLHADGTVTERVRTLEIPLDENALGPLGELDLPAGAALLALRTHKADGRVLDADAQSTGEKRTVSAASLQTGDTLEIDYLMVTPPPRRGLGGLAEAFYFAAADSSLTRSIYTVRTDGPAKLDRHRVDGPTAANGTVVTERTHVNALPAEPNTPPQNEFYPWMQLGSGNTESDLARSVADQLLDKTTVDSALAAQISELRKSPTHDQRAQAETLWQWLSATVRAQGGSLSEPASAVMGQGSGNLLLPMRASLAALGIASHLVLVSSPGQSQEPHRFARLGEYGDVVLRIEPKGSAPTYLAAAIREAPFGRLPPNLCGARALVIPNVDAPGEVITLPPCPAQPDSLDGPDDHSIDLRLSLSPDGSLTGTAKETLNGFEAAALRSSLEELGDEQRRQGIESALASIFQGVALGDLAFSLGKGPGAPTTVSYRFEVPQLADRESGGDWSLPLRGFPAQLATRFAQLATRKLPLLISNGERPGLSLRLQLPAGAMPLGQLPADLWLTSPFGSYLRRERWEGGRVQLTEKLVLPPQRIAPADYAAFAVFADKVDQAQSERLRYHLQSNQAAMSPPAPGAPEATALRPRAPPRSPAPSRGEKRTHAFVAD